MSDDHSLAWVPGALDKDYVSTIDLGPTMLNAVGLDIRKSVRE